MRCNQSGITLVEMMVALSVFSVLCVASLGVMRVGLDSHEQLTYVDQSVAEFQMARALIKDDLIQVANRRVRSAEGARSEAPFLGGAFRYGQFEKNERGDRLLAAFTTNGRTNPGAAYPRSELQYVEYWEAEQSLIRRSWVHTDRVQDTPASDQILFQNISEISVRFHDGSRWSDQWRSRAGQVAPIAIELTFQHPELGAIEQLFFVEGEGP